MNKRYLLRYLFISIALVLNACEAAPPGSSAVFQFTSSEAKNANASVETAYAKKLSDIQVSGHGVVIKLLPDDQKGAQHQKFLVRINTIQTLLFAHNIDLAERLPLKVGDEVSFNGEYVYNPKGGILHWTHLDPKGIHTPGWILLQGKKYQ